MMVSRLARRQVKVALSGDGGDELFGGYPGYYVARALHRATSDLSPPLRRLAVGALDALVAGISGLHRLVPATRPGPVVNRARQISSVMRAAGGLNEFYGQLYSAWAEPPPLMQPAQERAARWQAAEHRDIVRDAIDRMGYFALLGTLVDGTLAKWDRASMASSLEVRVPFLDHRIVEYAWQLPPSVKYGKPAGSKQLLRRILYRHVPEELIDRPKKGFSSPMPGWLRGPLRDWAETLLDERQLREEGLFDAGAVRECWNQHVSGGSDYWQLLWSVLMFRQWHCRWAPSDASWEQAA